MTIRSRPPERDYSHRDVLDKLGIKPGQALAFDDGRGRIDPDLRRRALARCGRPPADTVEQVDVALVGLGASAGAVELMRLWRGRIKPAGGIWLLTPKRGLPGYVDQNTLIALGPEAGLVDNKSCSVSDQTSALRFVIRKAEREG